MFHSPAAAVIGATDLARTAGFLHLFGFEEVAKDTLPAAVASALYGVSRNLADSLLAVPGSESGRVRVIGPVAAAARHRDHYATGAHAFDLYCRDIEASLEVARAGGWRTGPVGHVELGPLVMDQAMVTGPDGLAVVLIQSERRRPSLLDTAPEALHSEGHSFIWAVDEIDAALPFWAGLPGLTVPFDAPVVHPEVNRFMGLPDDDAKLRMAMICDEAVSPMRFELLEFVGRSGVRPSAWPLAAGLHAPAFVVNDLDAARAVLASQSAQLGDVVKVDSTVHPGARGCSATAPGGVRFEVWEEA